ncbi:hypothetical protein Naga_103833g1 [Nannochloropsis gaditana]|uniref:Uncharacterized protein n=1 Tax=Nannochloropsis gaditana TaxID=72520 RepID=W7TEZ2_9STRA|nr:hypothetical protein Naga_103833g1 [Nannochloropsis gaditana]
MHSRAARAAAEFGRGIRREGGKEKGETSPASSSSSLSWMESVGGRDEVEEEEEEEGGREGGREGERECGREEAGEGEDRHSWPFEMDLEPRHSALGSDAGGGHGPK